MPPKVPKERIPPTGQRTARLSRNARLELQKKMSILFSQHVRRAWHARVMSDKARKMPGNQRTQWNDVPHLIDFAIDSLNLIQDHVREHSYTSSDRSQVEPTQKPQQPSEQCKQEDSSKTTEELSDKQSGGSTE